jgi:hypothetical protein
MRLPSLVPLQTNVPDWLALAVIVASIALAVATVSMMLLRLRPSADEDTSPARVVRDPVLLTSAVGVVILAVAAWLLR